jgi:pilus assembly protein Flp/PilA
VLAVDRPTGGVNENLLTRFVNDESGATAIKYGLIAALIVVMIIGAVRTLGTTLSAKFGTVSTAVK